MSEAEKTAQDAAEKTEEIVQDTITDVKTNAQIVVDMATARAEEADKNAQAIADAALRSELGNRMQKYEEDHGQWRASHEATQQEIAMLRAENQSLAETLNQVSSTLGKLTQQPTTQEMMEIINPNPQPEKKEEEGDRREAEQNQEQAPPKNSGRLRRVL